MPKKKGVIQNALEDLKEIETAGMENAKAVVVEAFKTDLKDVFQSAISEEEFDAEFGDDEEDELEEGDLATDGNTTTSDTGYDKKPGSGDADGEIENTTSEKDPTDHEAAKGQTPEQGKSIAEDDDPSTDDGDERDNEDALRAENDDGDADDLFGDEDVDESLTVAVSEEDDEEDDLDLDLEPDVDDDVFEPTDEADEDELDLGDEEDGGDIGDDVPPEDGGDIGDDVPDDDEELEIPEELFADEAEGDEDDEELDIDIEDDELPVDGGEDELDLGDEDALDLGGEDDEFEEGLYVRREGQFVKITPQEALEARIGELEEERENLSNAVGLLNTKLKESNLYNAKVTFMYRILEAANFTKEEKDKLAEKLDACKTILQVKKTARKALKEVRDINPLDDLQNSIVENRNRRAKYKGENVYNSPEMERMLRNAGIGDAD